MTEIMPVPRNSNITVLRPPSIAEAFLHVKITCRKFNKIRENLSKTVAYCIESKYNIHGRKFDLIIKFIKMEG